MKLDKNYWRTGWVLCTNGLLTSLLLIGPIRAHHNQQLLHQVVGTATPVFSYWKELFSDPLTPMTAAVLMAGIILEFRRNLFSPLFNLGPYAAWLISLLKAKIQQGSDAEVALSLRIFLIPLLMIIVIDSTFYFYALWKLRAARHLYKAG